MQSTSGIIRQLDGMRQELHDRYHVKRIGIFGSYSQGRQKPVSDLDLMVEFERPIGMFAFIHLRNLLMERLKIKVDLVTPDGLHPLIRDDVMREVLYV
ncbi:MAG TPA: nucleotidyltransferase family protein [Methanoregula sp.]|nr:nucleotidyltransferase family protein [Methanoregula sp.]